MDFSFCNIFIKLLDRFVSIVDIVVVDIVEVIYRIELDKLVYLYLVCFSGKKKREYLDVSYKKKLEI